jgi:hypothetical protein
VLVARLRLENPRGAAQQGSRVVQAEPPVAEPLRRRTTGKAARPRHRWAWAIVAAACGASAEVTRHV